MRSKHEEKKKNHQFIYQFRFYNTVKHSIQLKLKCSNQENQIYIE